MDFSSVLFPAPLAPMIVTTSPERTSRLTPFTAWIAPYETFTPSSLNMIRSSRSDGRIVVGSTLEDAGFDKRVNPETIQTLHQKAAHLAPELGQARMLEAWAGLRPGTPDELPILGRGAVEGYFLATGHYRNGILLAPITAVLMTQLIRGVPPEFELESFGLSRF